MIPLCLEADLLFSLGLPVLVDLFGCYRAQDGQTMPARNEMRRCRCLMHSNRNHRATLDDYILLAALLFFFLTKASSLSSALPKSLQSAGLILKAFNLALLLLQLQLALYSLRSRTPRPSTSLYF